MKTELTPEDHALLESLDRLARDGEDALDKTGEARELAELYALQSYDLTPEPPRGEVWSAIERQISEEASGTVVQFPRRAAVAGEDFAAQSQPVPAPAQRPVSRMMWAMAAMLGFCLLGMGYLLARTEFQRSTIEDLRSDLAAERSSIQAMRQVQDQYSMVTRTAREYYPLRPVSHLPEAAEPMYGRVWVCGFHQKWLLNVEGLGPAPPGHEYRFWFETQGGKVEAGVVQIEGGVGRLSDTTMPDGTTGFFMTLEPQAVAEGGDSVLEILRSEESHEILLGIEDDPTGDQTLSM